MSSLADVVSPPAPYQVFARKYRPQTFGEVVGQDHVVQTLQNALRSRRLAQAWLFVGPRGIGKTTTARILAKALCCERGGPTPDPCGVCSNCREIADGRSLDVIEIDGASNNSVESARELIENSRFAPAKSPFKIYLIDEVHMLSKAAFNALLKTLEEPPPHVKFIFATTEADKVLPTILSRCQRFDLRRIPAPVIARHLRYIADQEKVGLPEDAAFAVARGAQGGLRDAESMLDQLVSFCGDAVTAEDVRGVFGFTAPERVAALVDQLFARSAAGALGWLDEEAAAGRDLLRVLADLIAHLRNLLVARHAPDSLAAELDEAMLARVREQSGAVTAGRLMELIDHFGAAEQRIKWAPDRKLHFEIALIKATQLLGQATLEDVIDSLAALRGGGDGTNGQPASARPATVPAAARAPTPSPAAASPAAERGAGFGAVRRALGDNAPERRAAAPAAPVAPPVASAPPVSAASAVREDSPPPAASVEAVPADAPTAGELWSRLLNEMKTKRPLIAAWIAKGAPLDPDVAPAKEMAVAYGTADKALAESLGANHQRKPIEELLAELAGRPLRLRVEVREDFVPPPEPASASSRREAPSPPPPGGAALADLQEDPHIRRALDIFEAEIVGYQPAAAPKPQFH